MTAASSSTATTAETTGLNPKVVADQIVAIAAQLRTDAHDQETIRVALHSFSQVMVQSTPLGTVRGPF